MRTITVSISIDATLDKVWACWTHPNAITKWNFASPEWHCPKATNDCRVGGEFHYRMAAKDNSASFDFWGTYTAVEPKKQLAITLGDHRKMTVHFESKNDGVTVTETFEAEAQNPPELQRAGWQAILDNFRLYVEGTG